MTSQSADPVEAVPVDAGLVDVAVVDAVREALTSAGDPVRGAAQQAYMKSEMPFLGVTSPQRRALLRPILSDPAHRFESRERWGATIRALWDGAQHREERYAALDLLRHRAYRGWRDSDVMPLVHHLITTGAWWDLVDEAVHVVGEVLLKAPEVEGLRMRGWAVDEDMWVRRAAVLSQLEAKARTDAALLSDVIVVNLGDREFFVRKAIGWALRQYARVDPAWVRAFVAGHEGELSGLSRREALKHL